MAYGAAREIVFLLLVMQARFYNLTAMVMMYLIIRIIARTIVILSSLMQITIP